MRLGRSCTSFSLAESCTEHGGPKLEVSNPVLLKYYRCMWLLNDAETQTKGCCSI